MVTNSAAQSARKRAFLRPGLEHLFSASVTRATSSREASLPPDEVAWFLIALLAGTAFGLWIVSFV